MGFWSGLGKVLKGVGEVAGEMAANAPKAYYEMGKSDGLEGRPSRTDELKRSGVTDNYLEPYRIGYDDGHKERIERIRGKR